MYTDKGRINARICRNSSVKFVCDVCQIELAAKKDLQCRLPDFDEILENVLKKTVALSAFVCAAAVKTDKTYFMVWNFSV